MIVSRSLRIFLTIMLIPLIYLSSVRFVSQLFFFTGKRTLYENENVFRPPSSQTLSAKRNILSFLVYLDPLYPEYHYLLARQVFFQDIKRAEDLTIKTLRLSPIDPEYWTFYGWIKTTEGQLQEGYKAFLKAIELNPGRPGSYIQQALFLNYILPLMDANGRSLYKVIIDLDLQIARNLDIKFFLQNPYVYLVAAANAAYSNDRKTALEWLNRIPDSFLTDWQFILQVWALYFQLGSSYRPIAHFSQLLNNNKLTIEQLNYIEREIKTRYKASGFRYILAQIYIFKGDIEQAEKELIALNSQQNFAEYKILLASIYEKQGRFQEAFRLYQQAMELSPSNQIAKKKVIEYYSKGFKGRLAK